MIFYLFLVKTVYSYSIITFEEQHSILQKKKRKENYSILGYKFYHFYEPVSIKSKIQVTDIQNIKLNVTPNFDLSHQQIYEIKIRNPPRTAEKQEEEQEK